MERDDIGFKKYFDQAWAQSFFNVPIGYMDREELIALADKILKQEGSAEDIRKYNAWYNALQHGGEMPIENAEEKKAVLLARINLDIANAPVRRLWSRTWPRITIAAAIAGIVFGLWFYEIAPLKNFRNDELAMNDITPGTNTASLTLANGKTITLSDAKRGIVMAAGNISYNDGSSLGEGTPQQSDNNVEVKTPRGGTYQVTLSDGTHVWMNADSKISFPPQFKGAVRKVFLDGEAYFEVAKLTNHGSVPFIVASKRQEVTVLGTHFNINSYADEISTKTTLLEGSVKVTSLQEALTQDIILKPGQQSILTTNQIAIKQADPLEAVAWKDGLFIFDTESLGSIMKRIARWYDVEVIYSDNKADKLPFSGSVSRFKNISSLLKQLESAGQVKFNIEGRKIIVTAE